MGVGKKTAHGQHLRALILEEVALGLIEQALHLLDLLGALLDVLLPRLQALYARFRLLLLLLHAIDGLLEKLTHPSHVVDLVLQLGEELIDLKEANEFMN